MSAFNGSGTFIISGTGLPFVTGTTISSTVSNQLNTDLAVGLSTCLTKNGQTVPTGNIPLGGFKITDLGVATATGDALSYGAVGTISDLTISGTLTYGGVTLSAAVTGTGNMVLDTGPTITGATISASGTITPSSTNGIVGTIVADDANAGSVGEYISATQSSPVGYSSGVSTNIVSISLTPGDWDVSGVGNISTNGSNLNSNELSISTVSATLGTLGTYTQTFGSASLSSTTLPTPIVRVNVSTTTTTYLVANSVPATGTLTATGFIRARRIR